VDVRHSNDGEDPTADLESPAATVRTLFRYLVPVLLFAGLVASGTRFITRSETPAQAAAEARVALTEVVVWPFYDAARDRQVTVIETDRDRIMARTGNPDGVLDISASAPLNQSFVDIVATAESGELAIEAAGAALDHLLEVDRDQQLAPLQPELDAAVEALSESNAAIADLDARILALAQALASADAQRAATPAESRAAIDVQIAELQLERSALDVERNRNVLRRASARDAIDRAETEIESIAPSIEVVRRPTTTGVTDSGSFLQVALAAVIALALGTLAAMFWDRRFALLRTPGQLAAAGGSPVLGDVSLGTARNNRHSETEAALRLYDAAVEADTRIVGLTGPAAMCTVMIHQMAAALDRIGFRVEIATTVGSIGRHGHTTELDLSKPELQRLPALRAELAASAERCDLVLVNCGDLDGSERARWLQRGCDALVLVVPAGLCRMPLVRRFIRSRYLGIPYLGSILFHDTVGTVARPIGTRPSRSVEPAVTDTGSGRLRPALVLRRPRP
jgi:hypothetical protein